jgi:hypothetical protein
LLRGARAVLAFAHVLKFLSDKFAGLCRRRFTLLRVTTRAFDYFFLWHRDFLSNPKAGFEPKLEFQSNRARNKSIEPGGH